MSRDPEAKEVSRLGSCYIPYNAWQGDIKPENILSVQGRYKLADAGEARICRVKKRKEKGRPRISMIGGTHKYAPPEKTPYLDEAHPVPESILQTSDVWSLGCVLSVAATSAILGPQGVLLLYDEVRRRAIEEWMNPNVKAGDGFHDGKSVLPIIHDWHESLRVAARKTDPWTEQILAMVDEHMLLDDGEKRWEAAQVCDHFGKILINTPTPSAPECVESVRTILQRIDLQQLIEERRSSARNSGTYRPKSPEAASSLDKPEAGLDPQRKPTEIPINKTKIQPVMQRSQPQAGSPRKGSRVQELRLDGRDDVRRPGPGSVSSSTSVFSRQSLQRTALSTGLSQDADSEVTTPQINCDPGAYEDFGDVQNWCQVEDYLDSNPAARAWNLPDIFSLRSLQGTESSIRGTEKADPLQGYFDNRDIIFVVDNGRTMRRHWKEATYLLHILVWRSMGYDADGVELYFTNTDTPVPIEPNRNQKVKDFNDAMMRARPKPGDEHKTNFIPRLNKIILNNATETTQRYKSIMVLTDGIWEGMNDQEIHEWVKMKLHLLSFLHRPPSTNGQGLLEPEDLALIRPVTLQFISFGTDTKALQRLQYLDDGLEKEGLTDLIDTEPSYGDIYKMLLGPLDKKYDSLYTVHPPSTPISPPPRGRGGSASSLADSSHTSISRKDSTTAESSASPSSGSTSLWSPVQQLSQPSYFSPRNNRTGVKRRGLSGKRISQQIAINNNLLLINSFPAKPSSEVAPTA